MCVQERKQFLEIGVVRGGEVAGAETENQLATVSLEPLNGERVQSDGVAVEGVAAQPSWNLLRKVP